MTLAGARAIVTGASRGIGEAVARALDGAGVTTLLVARSAGALSTIAGELRHARVLSTDLRHPDAATEVSVRAAAELGGPVDILVSNAGTFVVADIPDTSDAALDEHVALNISAPFRLVRAVLPGMRDRGAGHIITIGSVADRQVFPGNAAYAATKHAARALHEAVRTETRGTGIRVSLVSPGPVDTSIWDPYDPDTRPGFTPRARMLRPSDVADAVLWALTRRPAVNVDELRINPA
jgi:NADP-dependent 3-hydroxy acid dehydrogenase YdfG